MISKKNKIVLTGSYHDNTIQKSRYRFDNNGSGSGVNLNVQVTDTSASSTFRIFNESVSGTATKDIINFTLVLEGGDILKMTAGTANEIQGIISYALLDRSQQNG